MKENKEKQLILAEFSPSGSTNEIGTYLIKKLGEKTGMPWQHRSFTKPSERKERLFFDKDSWVVFAMPVYAGRLPSLLKPYLSHMQGRGAKVFLVSVYGNRHYDDALREMEEFSIAAGMTVVGGAAIVARHVFSEIIARGRPDKKDFEIIDRYIPSIIEAFTAGNSFVIPGEGELKYYQPTGIQDEKTNIVKVKPSTKAGCIACQKCVESCPLGSIDSLDPRVVSGKCMKCCACLLACPLGLKHFDDRDFQSHLLSLEENFIKRREPEFFLP